MSCNHSLPFGGGDAYGRQARSLRDLRDRAQGALAIGSPELTDRTTITLWQIRKADGPSPARAMRVS